jgi:predicted sulfurtransferase
VTRKLLEIVHGKSVSTMANQIRSTSSKILNIEELLNSNPLVPLLNTEKKRSREDQKLRKKEKKRVFATFQRGTEKESSKCKIETGSQDERKGATACLASLQPRPLVESSALPPHLHSKYQQNETGASVDDEDAISREYPVTLLLFYQYVEPTWDDPTYKFVQEHIHALASSLGITGRMRLAKEGLNCTLSGTPSKIRQFCEQLRIWKPKEFHDTEFKLTHHLLEKYRFPGLKIIPVSELVHYGLEGSKAPPIQLYSGTHLEPGEYHRKLGEPNTVVIDVRNHYEASIGHFEIPKDQEQSSTFLDPKMRKSTEFPVWLDQETTKDYLKGKQVLMYCTGGIRCERASALLKYKIANDPSMQQLNIKGVYQLQGGIDKYFKEFPDGGRWVGKNYTFDKRCAHEPVETIATAVSMTGDMTTMDIEAHRLTNGAPDACITSTATPLSEQKNDHKPLGKCSSCLKPWDNYGGKPCRCPTCGVPNLICKDCYISQPKKVKQSIRCDLCVEQNIHSKKDLRNREHIELVQYEQRNQFLRNFAGTVIAAAETASPIVPAIEPILTNGVTRLYLRNMCRKNMTVDILLSLLPNITHIVWKNDKNGIFLGQGWIEMKDPRDAAVAVQQSGQLFACGRPLYIEFQPPDPKDIWPPQRSAVPHQK